MAFHTCVIHGPDGAVLCRDIRFNLEETRGGKATKWFGTITSPEASCLAAGQRYRMILDDGRSGEIHVRRNTMAGESDRAVAFDGMTPLA